MLARQTDMSFVFLHVNLCYMNIVKSSFANKAVKVFFLLGIKCDELMQTS